MPDWKQSNNLRQTRIKDDERDEVLNFKEIRWGTMKVNADAAYKAEVGNLFCVFKGLLYILCKIKIYKHKADILPKRSMSVSPYTHKI